MEGNIDIGSRLKEKRQELGFSVGHVASKTLMSQQYITALEENRFSDMPAKVFVLGALKKYSQFLGLDPEEMLSEFKKYHMPAVPQTVISIRHSDIVARKSSRNRIIRILIIAALTAGGIFAAILLIRTVIRTASSIKAERAETKRQTNILELKTTEDVWIRIREEDANIFEGILPPNTVKTFETLKNPALRIGNVRGVTVTYNGKIVEIPTDRPSGVGEIKLK